ncbi:MAG: phosphoribosylglycinamide formyltransferase [Nitriliruptoraceae bacterium]
MLASGRGSNLLALLDAIDADPDFGGQVVVVGSDRPQAGALQHATDRGIATLLVEPPDHPDRAAWEQALIDGLRPHDVEVVVLAGFMRILSTAFVDTWPDRILNTHPSLLPAFPGGHAVRDTLEHGVKVSGVTVHLVDDGVDTGAIIAQRAVDVLDGDDEQTLHARIQDVEHVLYPQVVRLLCHHRIERRGHHVHVHPPAKEPS